MADSNETAPRRNDLREVAIRTLISNIVGPKWAPLADAGMTLMGNDAGEVYHKGKDFLGNVMSGYWQRMGEDPARRAYEGLTTQKTMTDTMKSEGTLRGEHPIFNPKPPIRESYTSTPRDDNPTGVGRTRSRYIPQEGGSKYGIHRMDDAFLNKDAGWRRVFYENPEMTAEAIGATTAAAPLLAGGALLSSIAAGNKPRSRYSYPVEPDRGGYDPEVNPNVEAAKASNYYQNQILDKKHAHAREIMALREQSRTPGVQDISQGAYGSGVTSGLSSENPFAKAMLSTFGDTRVQGLDDNFGRVSSTNPQLITLNSPQLRMNTF